MATDLRCVRQREFHSLVVVHCKLVCDATFLLRMHHEGPIAGCPPWHTVVQEKRPSAFTSSVHLILTCAIPALFKLHSLKHQCREGVEFDRYSQIKSGFRRRAWCMKFIHSTHASLWVSLTRLDGPTTLNTNQVCLDLHIRPLVNLFPLAFYFLHSEIYIWTILWVSGWI